MINLDFSFVLIDYSRVGFVCGRLELLSLMEQKG